MANGWPLAIAIVVVEGMAGALPLRADERVFMSDSELSAIVSAALVEAKQCHASARASFGLAHTERLSIVFVAGNTGICKASGATSYVRRSVSNHVYVCAAFRHEPVRQRPIILIHEVLHLHGVEDDHSDSQALNRRIARACGWLN